MRELTRLTTGRNSEASKLSSRAVSAAFRGGRAEFLRTPKYRLEGTSGDLRSSAYRGFGGRAWTAAEMLLGIYFTCVSAWAIMTGRYTALPFFLLFQMGYLYTSFLSLAQAVRRRLRPVPSLTLPGTPKKRLDAGTGPA